MYPYKSRAPALAYLRTSSAANVGTDKDSEKRQRQSVAGFARRGGFEIVAEFYDAAVSGADPIETRAGFAALLDRIEGNGVRTVIVEEASRFARELMAQELGIALLISRGVQLLTASGDDLTASDDPTRKMMRQIAGAFAEYEKARLVHKSSPKTHGGQGFDCLMMFFLSLPLQRPQAEALHGSCDLQTPASLRLRLRACRSRCHRSCLRRFTTVVGSITGSTRERGT
jgi:Resolvase, N terminal domain